MRPRWCNRWDIRPGRWRRPIRPRGRLNIRAGSWRRNDVRSRRRGTFRPRRRLRGRPLTRAILIPHDTRLSRIRELRRNPGTAEKAPGNPQRSAEKPKTAPRSIERASAQRPKRGRPQSRCNVWPSLQTNRVSHFPFGQHPSRHNSGGCDDERAEIAAPSPQPVGLDGGHVGGFGRQPDESIASTGGQHANSAGIGDACAA